MSTKRSFLFVGLMGFLLVSTSLLAHHGYAAYDMTTTISLKGIITSFEMANPHSSIAFDVKNADGNVEHWVVEGGTVRSMKDGGFAPDTLKPGDQVTIYLSPGKDRQKHVGAWHRVELLDGRVLPLKRANSPDQ